MPYNAGKFEYLKISVENWNCNEFLLILTSIATADATNGAKL
jgi:hypothetical protein